MLIELFFEFPLKTLLLFILATPVQFVVGLPFYRRAYGALRNRSATVDTLVVLSTTTAYLYSVAATFFIPAPTFYEASATVITTITLGMLLENISSGRAGDAIIQSAKEKGVEIPVADAFTAIPGKGTRATYKNHHISLGNRNLMKEDKIEPSNIEDKIEKNKKSKVLCTPMLNNR